MVNDVALDDLERLTPALDEWYERCAHAASHVIGDVLHHLPDGGVFVDVGANVGVVSAAAADEGAEVYAFEPIPVYAAYVQRRLPDVKVYPVALGVECETRTLWCDDVNLGWNTFTDEKLTPGMTQTKVKVLPLDMYPDIRPDVVKIDTEGYEWAVIRGAHRMIETHRPVIVVEVGWGTEHPHRAEVVEEMEWLFSIGYQRVPYEYARTTTDFVLVP